MKLIKTEEIQGQTWHTYEVTTIAGALGDMETEWWTDKDWQKHKEDVAKMKADGTYGKEIVYEVMVMNYPVTDSKEVHTNPLESYSVDIFDFGKPVNNE